jgi:hypothetical protein
VPGTVPLAAASPARPSPPPVPAPIPSPSAPPNAEAPVRAPAASQAGPDEPGAWVFRVRRGTTIREVRAAGFGTSGATAVAVTSSRIAFSRGHGWEEVPLSIKLDLTRVCAVRPFGPDYLLLGAGGLVARVTLGGACEFWPLEPHAGAPVAANELTFFDAITEGDGAVLVGDRLGAAGTVGIVARAAARSVRIAVIGTPAVRLRGVARVSGGRLLACGGGKVVAIERDVVVGSTSLSPGELYGIVANDDGALVVGAGGYAFHVSRFLAATLEEVQTTADLVSLTMAGGGAAWAGSHGRGRILRRAPTGVWARVSGNLGSEAGVLALAATEGEVRAVLEDGMFVTGTLG